MRMFIHLLALTLILFNLQACNEGLDSSADNQLNENSDPSGNPTTQNDGDNPIEDGAGASGENVPIPGSNEVGDGGENLPSPESNRLGVGVASVDHQLSTCEEYQTNYEEFVSDANAERLVNIQLVGIQGILDDGREVKSIDELKAFYPELESHLAIIDQAITAISCSKSPESFAEEQNINLLRAFLGEKPTLAQCIPFDKAQWLVSMGLILDVSDADNACQEVWLDVEEEQANRILAALDADREQANLIPDWLKDVIDTFKSLEDGQFSLKINSTPGTVCTEESLTSMMKAMDIVDGDKIVDYVLGNGPAPGRNDPFSNGALLLNCRDEGSLRQMAASLKGRCDDLRFTLLNAGESCLAGDDESQYNNRQNRLLLMCQRSNLENFSVQFIQSDNELQTIRSVARTLGISSVEASQIVRNQQAFLLPDCNYLTDLFDLGNELRTAEIVDNNNAPKPVFDIFLQGVPKKESAQGSLIDLLNRELGLELGEAKEIVNYMAVYPRVNYRVTSCLSADEARRWVQVLSTFIAENNPDMKVSDPVMPNPEACRQ